MKKIIILFVCFVIASINLNAQSICSPQCTPDIDCLDGTSPDDMDGEMCPAPEEWHGGMRCTPYELTLTIYPPQTAVVFGITLDAISKMEITDAKAKFTTESNWQDMSYYGFSWCRSIVKMPSHSYSCVFLSGTPMTAGTLQFKVTLKAYKTLAGQDFSIPGGTLDTIIGAIVVADVQSPIAGFSANPTNTEENQSIQFTDNSTNSPTSWLWNFGDGTTSTVQNPTHTYASEGTYTVSLTVSNSCGQATETKNNYITINTIGINNSTILEEVSVFPNPAQNNVTVKADNVESITVLDVRGLIVYYEKTNNTENVIDISNLQKANYIVKIKANNQMYTKTFLKQ